MRKTWRLCLLIAGYFYCTSGVAQTDTSFWFAAPAITASHENRPVIIRMASYSQPADILITQPANPAFSAVTLHLNSNSAGSVDLTSQLNLLENKPGNTILNYGIKIKSTNNISAYYEVGRSLNPEIFPLKGQIAAGLSFIIPMQTRFDNHAGHVPPAHNGFVMVATEDDTQIQIRLTQPDSVGHAVNVPFTITLQKGQTYAVIAGSNLVAAHLGGSSILSSKPICVTMYDDSIFLSPNYDLIGDQIVPEINTGSEFILVRGALNYTAIPNQDFYYVWASVNNTEIFVNGILTATINRGQSYEGRLSAASVYITTSQPVYVLQFTGVGQEVAATSLPGIKCTGSQQVSFVRSTTETFYLNILCKATDIGGFSLNGNTGIITSSLFQNVPGTNGIWMAARLDASNFPAINSQVLAGAVTAVTNSSGLFHLGFLNGGSGTGTRLGYFSNYSKVQLSPVITSTTCAGADIQLYATPYSNVTYQWTGPNNFNSNRYNPVIPNAGLPDAGTYYITANIGGCGITKDSLQVAVHPLPEIRFVKSLDTVCAGASKNVSFTLTGKAPWKLVYTDGVLIDSINAINQPAATFVASPAGNTIYRVKQLLDANTCLAASTVVYPSDTMVVNPLPVADLGYTTLTCEKAAITFTDKSKAGLDTLVKWYWKFGDGTIREANRPTAFDRTYAQWGNDSIRISVQSSLGCKSDTVQKVLTIHPLPTVGFRMPSVCLNDAVAQFTDTTRMADGNQPQTFQWYFYGAGSSPVVPVNKYPVPAVSSLQNPLVQYSLASNYQVKEVVTSTFGCTDSLSKTFTVNGARPKASFVILDSTRLCGNRLVQLQNFSTVDFGTVSRLEIFWKPTVVSMDTDPVSGKKYSYQYPAFQFPATQQYVVKLIARSGNASVCADSVTSILTLRQSPKVTFSALPGICKDTTARQITEARETGGVPGTFAYIGTGISPSGLINPQVLTPATYPVTYLYSTALGCSDSATQNLTVWPSPVAQWRIGLPLCEKSPLLFMDSSSTGFGKLVNWFWNFGDTTLSVKTSANPFTKVYSGANRYTASLRVITDSGCRSPYAMQTVTVHPKPVPRFGMPIICLPEGSGLFTDSSTISDQSENLFTYRWKFGDPADASIALLKNPIHRYSGTGPYAVSLQVTSKEGCTDSLVQSITTIYPQPKAAFTLQKNEVCVGDTLQFFDATAQYTGSIVSRTWDLSQGFRSTLPNPFRKFADSGSYTISLFIRDTKGCVSDTALQKVTINPYPHLTMPGKQVVLEGGSIPLLPLWFAINPAFNWTPADYLDNAGIAYPVTSPKQDITYRLTVTGKGNCVVDGDVFVKVLLGPVIPNIFSPNGDGINDAWVIEYLDSYPGCEVEVYNRGGQIVFRSVGYDKPWDGLYQGKPLPVGTYYYFINPKNGRALMSGSITLIR